MHRSEPAKIAFSRAVEKFRQSTGISPPAVLFLGARLLGIATSLRDKNSSDYIIKMVDPTWRMKGLPAAPSASYAVERGLSYATEGRTKDAEDTLRQVVDDPAMEALPVHRVQALDLLAKVQKRTDDAVKLFSDALVVFDETSTIPPSIKSSTFLDLAATELISGDKTSAALHAAAANSLDVEVVGQDIRSVSMAEGVELYGFGRQFSAEDIILQIGTPEQKMELLARRKGKVPEDFFGSVESDDQACKGTWKLRREIFADELARSIQDADGDPARVNSRALLIEQLQRGERGCRQTSESDDDDVTAAKLVKAIPEKAVPGGADALAKRSSRWRSLRFPRHCTISDCECFSLKITTSISG